MSRSTLLMPSPPVGSSVRAARQRGSAPHPHPRRASSGMQAERIGVLGGTFDPPHVGHLWLATLAADALELDRVLFMPAGQPPHKRGRQISSAAERLLMTRLAIDGDPLFTICPIEMERPGPSFTIDSVEELLRLYPDDQLYLLMATDSLAQVDTWREPERLLALVEWGVAPRAGTVPPDRDELRARFGTAHTRIKLLDGPALDVSASAIRARVAAGRAIRYLVPRSVEELITERGLYRPERG